MLASDYKMFHKSSPFSCVSEPVLFHLYSFLKLPMKYINFSLKKKKKAVFFFPRINEFYNSKISCLMIAIQPFKIKSSGTDVFITEQTLN